MKSPFVKASCGCIVIPLHHPSKSFPDMMQCILIEACDRDGYANTKWSFNVRDMESHKVVYDQKHNYRGDVIPHELDEEWTLSIIRSICTLMVIGGKALELTSALDMINRCRSEKGADLT